MKVADVLAEKGHAVYTTQAEGSLLDAATILRDRAIGAVVVTDVRGTPVGILSERDIVRALANHGPAVMEREVGEFMTENVVSCHEDDTVEDILEQMTERRFRHMPVLSDGRLVGLISIGDAVRIKIAQIEAEAELLKSYITNAS